MTEGSEQGEGGFAVDPGQAPEIVLADDWNEELGIEIALDVVVPTPVYMLASVPELVQMSVSEAETYRDVMVLHSPRRHRAHWQMVSATVDWYDNQLEDAAYPYSCGQIVYRLALGDVR